ncbi:HHE domain protein [Zopfia rhizophila CBS 207.26]|uniref:HHE domain protein n=1 Tax=Zopfia rhizophila CBS 207.26 TaxID=1314779 RepID=A0A6A6DAA5_9PEZI|nr:HHE domain protein [Zopfia rhizophila CBS 207.26]
MFKQSLKPVRSIFKAQFISSVRSFSAAPTLNMRISQRIKDDHDTLRDEYNNIKNAKSADEKTRWRNQFTWDLARHSVGEELVVYPEFERHLENGKAMADHDRAEHNEVKAYLATVQDMQISDPTFDGHLDDLWKMLSKHMEEEEKNDLPALEEELTTEDSDELSNSLERTKMFLPTKSHPHAPDKPPFETVAGLLATPIDMLRDIFRKFPKEK